MVKANTTHAQQAGFYSRKKYDDARAQRDVLGPLCSRSLYI